MINHGRGGVGGGALERDSPRNRSADSSAPGNSRERVINPAPALSSAVCQLVTIRSVAFSFVGALALLFDATAFANHESFAVPIDDGPMVMQQDQFGNIDFAGVDRK